MDDAIRRRLHEQAINASEKVRKASADYQDWLDLAERKLRKKDERIAELEAENEALREAAQRYLDAGKHTQEKIDSKVALWRALAPKESSSDD